MSYEETLERGKELYEQKSYKEAAEHGYRDAQRNLANLYWDGDADESVINQSLSVKWYTEAAKQGDVEVQFMLGKYYMNGEGVPQDKEMAKYWFKKAADEEDIWDKNSIHMSVDNFIPQIGCDLCE